MERRLSYYATAILLLCASCAEQEVVDTEKNDGNICFKVTVASDWNMPWTRAAQMPVATSQLLKGDDMAKPLFLQTTVEQGIDLDKGNGRVTRATKYTATTLPENETGTFRVSGYRYGSTQTVSAVEAANFLDNTEVKYVSGQWKAVEQFVMPYSGDRIDFFAWYIPTGTMGVAAVTPSSGGLALTYAVPADPAVQPDLLTAVTRGETYSKVESYAVDLEFGHQLTAVNFVLDENVAPGTINEIAFLNVYTSGTLAITTGSTGTWTLTEAPPVTAYSDLNFSTVDGNSVLKTGQNIIPTLMMIPQNFTQAEQQIRIKMTIDGQQKILYADLKPATSNDPAGWTSNTTVTYRVSTSSVNVLRVGHVTYPDSWKEATGVKSAYANGDTIGVYSVDNTTGKVIYANKKYTLNVDGTDSTWVAADAATTVFAPGCTYYAYYPYKTTLTGAPAANAIVMSGNALPDAAHFFADAVTAWSPADDQNDGTKLNKQDLQIGISTPDVASTVTFAMAHTMGLASLLLAEGTIPETRFFIVDKNGDLTSDYVDSNERIDVAASTDFTASNTENVNTKMVIDGRKYYYVVNPRKTTITITGPSDGEGKWSDPTVELDVTEGSYKNYPVNYQGAYYYRGRLYSYQGYYQTFTVPADGNYRIECWGASGGLNNPYSGHGAYVAGNITLNESENLYVYVGGVGGSTESITTTTRTAGGWNGGGSCFREASGGGGASDVRLVNGDWNSTASLRSRIIVAGGGGGDETFTGYGGAAGGLTAPKVYGRAGSSSANYYITGGTQTSGGVPDSKAGGYSGTFGIGGNSSDNLYGGGGGSGWYGGAGGCNTPQNQSGDIGGTGGSSFISGHVGCNGVNSSGNHRGAGSPSIITVNNVERTITFSNTKMIDGNGNLWDTASNPTKTENMPKPAGSGTETGHLGNGYVRIASLTPVE